MAHGRSLFSFEAKTLAIPLTLAQIMTCFFRFATIFNRCYYILCHYITRWKTLLQLLHFASIFVIFRIVITFLAVRITFWGGKNFTLFLQRKYGEPFIVSTWGHCRWSIYRKATAFSVWEIKTPPFWGSTRPRCMKGTVQQNFTSTVLTRYLLTQSND